MSIWKRRAVALDNHHEEASHWWRVWEASGQTDSQAKAIATQETLWAEYLLETASQAFKDYYKSGKHNA